MMHASFSSSKVIVNHFFFIDMKKKFKMCEKNEIFFLCAIEIYFERKFFKENQSLVKR